MVNQAPGSRSGGRGVAFCGSERYPLEVVSSRADPPAQLSHAVAQSSGRPAQRRDPGCFLARLAGQGSELHGEFSVGPLACLGDGLPTRCPMVISRPLSRFTAAEKAPQPLRRASTTAGRTTSSGTSVKAASSTKTRGRMPQP